ncbi:Zinc finger protein rsv2 [Neolecta irregularis DAH-3]|uniref:Zinc finger protein rsv2 n=1 Tax=Neolecta irregularis (strain DAH-3) TaxID=1198029 RepID=A0A1U7LT51_NEOID|nr:Zinc finger protein rsv2 [Neolecta irregularis DAH-3]|eukprot:OLL25763.1 Zinc finger protein rsv2 [Neolecta irregularis DAH-3]
MTAIFGYNLADNTQIYSQLRLNSLLLLPHCMFQPDAEIRRQHRHQHQHQQHKTSPGISKPASCFDPHSQKTPHRQNIAKNYQNHLLKQRFCLQDDDSKFPVVVDGSEYVPPGFQNFPYDSQLKEIAQKKRHWSQTCRQSFELTPYFNSLDEIFPGTQYAVRQVMSSPRSSPVLSHQTLSASQQSPSLSDAQYPISTMNPYALDKSHHDEPPLHPVKFRRSFTDAAVDELYDSQQSSTRTSPANSIVGGICTTFPTLMTDALSQRSILPQTSTQDLWQADNSFQEHPSLHPFRDSLENDRTTVSPRDAFQPLDDEMETIPTDPLFDQSTGEALCFRECPNSKILKNIQCSSENNLDDHSYYHLTQSLPVCNPGHPSIFRKGTIPQSSPGMLYTAISEEVAGQSSRSREPSPSFSSESSSDSDFNPGGRSFSGPRTRPAQAEQNAYACTECPRRFSRPTSLAGHRRTHRGEILAAPTVRATADNVCDKINPLTGTCCNLPFSRPYDLYRHQETIHSDQRPVHRCEICNDGKRFSRQDALTRHRRVKHGISSRRGRGKHS